MELKARGQQLAAELRLVRHALHEVVGAVDQRYRAGSVDGYVQQPGGIRRAQHPNRLLASSKEPRSLLAPSPTAQFAVPLTSHPRATSAPNASRLRATA